MLISSATSSASVDRLWSICADLPRWAEYLDSFDSVEYLDAPAPVGVGSRFAMSQPGLPDSTYEITVWQPGASFVSVATAPGVRTTATHTVTSTGAGSRVDLGIEWSGPLAGLVRLLYSRKTQRMIDAEASTFARLAEAPDPADADE